MKMKTVTYDLSKWIPEPHVLRFCRKNNFNLGVKADEGNKTSAIAGQLENCLRAQEGQLIVIFEGDKCIGWGLACNTIRMCGTNTEFQMYVPARQRGKGLGKRILKKAIALRGKVRVFVTDQNEGFYKKCGVTPYSTITGRLIK